MKYFVRQKEAVRIQEELGQDLFAQICKIPHVFLCGGALTSIFSNSPIQDFDLYFLNKHGFNELESYLGSVRNVKLILTTDNAKTFKKEINNTKSIKIQLIKKPIVFEKSIESILNVFDFTVCQAGFDFDKKMFVSHDDFLLDLAKKELVFNIQSGSPLNSLFRLKKYLSKGFTITNKELLKIGLTLNKLDLSNKDLILENLAGLGSTEIKTVTSKLNSDGEINVPEILGDFLDGKFEPKLLDKVDNEEKVDTINVAWQDDEDIPF